jgi:hypothetical protein
MMKGWVLEALRSLAGQAKIIDVHKKVWEMHEEEIRKAGDLFYEWQYEIRWAADLLRREKKIRSNRGTWEILGHPKSPR